LAVRNTDIAALKEKGSK